MYVWNAISMTTKAIIWGELRKSLLIFPRFVVCADGIRMLLKHFYLVISCVKGEEMR